MGGVNTENYFKKLNGINVNEKVEKKNGLTYLSWAYAWGELKKIFPSATYKIHKFGEKQLPYVFDENTGYMVFTSVTINDLTHEMWLPVIDTANKTMKNEPYEYEIDEYVWQNNKKVKTGNKIKKNVDAATMFDINKAIMRCLTKNISMFGLGLYIYAGEDLPEEENPGYKCEICGAPFVEMTDKTGKTWTPKELYTQTKLKSPNMKAMCMKCISKYQKVGKTDARNTKTN